MSAERRRKAQDSDDDTQQAAKRIKTESEAEVTWQWEDDGNIWKDYSSDLVEQINDAFAKGHQKTTFTLGTTKIDVIFGRMVQRNVKTCWERRIRVKPKDDDDDETPSALLWQWEDENGRWNTYADAIQRLLYAAGCCAVNLVEFPLQGRKYQINIMKEEQTNKDTKVKRNIRKGVKEEKEDSTPSSSVASSSASSSTKRATQSKKSSDQSQTKGAAARASSTIVSKTTTEENDIKVTSLVFKGKVPVDEYCSAKERYHVLCEGDDIWDAMLNQTNLKNNNNKFYLLQLLEDNSSKKFAVWFRWGRVGLTGQHSLVQCGSDLEEAKEVFMKKFSDKTKNEWDDRKNFKKVHGKYDLLYMDYNSSAQDEDKVDAPPEQKVKRKESQLDKRLQNLIELISNIKEMEQTVMEMKYDTKKAPLGKLTKEQIKAGYKALKKIEACITKGVQGDPLVKACDEFYTRIPHVFGMQRPPVLRTKEQVQSKLELLEALGDIEIAMKVLSENEDMLVHPFDRHYKALNCGLVPIDPTDEIFETINKYVQNTHAVTHNQYKMEVLDVFECNKPGQEEAFQDTGNKLLLWHGSRLTNWVGILKKGLRIAPPEAPVTGYMFGKGVYFADVSSKSANYCFPSRTKNIGLVLLCEVSLGKSNELIQADYDANNLPEGCNSVKGLGRIGPDPSDIYTMPDGTIIPLGKLQDTGLSKRISGYTLNYNEYVVYDTNQIKLKYLVKLKFNFK